MVGQLTLFPKLVRNNEYEITHCANCGFKVPHVKLTGKWPYKMEITKVCPGCGMNFEIDNELIRLAELNNKRRHNE